jgi:hypothetical protein
MQGQETPASRSEAMNKDRQGRMQGQETPASRSEAQG